MYPQGQGNLVTQYMIRTNEMVLAEMPRNKAFGDYMKQKRNRGI